MKNHGGSYSQHSSSSFSSSGASSSITSSMSLDALQSNEADLDVNSFSLAHNNGSSSSSMTPIGHWDDPLYASIYISGRRDGNVNVNFIRWNVADGASTQYAFYHLIGKNPQKEGISAFANTWSYGVSAVNEDLDVYYSEEISIAHGEHLVVVETPGPYYVMLELQYRLPGDAEENRGRALAWTTNGKLSDPFRANASAPSLAINSSQTATIGTSISGHRWLEFQRQGYRSPTGITGDETLSNYYYSTFSAIEQYGGYSGLYYGRNNKQTKWRSGTYTVSFISTYSENSSIVSAGIDNAISEMNSVLGTFGVQFRRVSGSSADVVITYGTMNSLWGETYTPGGWVHGGEWSTDVDSSSYITGANIGISYEAIHYTKYEAVILEELYEACGVGIDQYEYPKGTLTFDGGEFHGNMTALTSKDINMLCLAYNTPAGATGLEACIRHNIPVGGYLVSTSTSNTTRTVDLNFVGKYINTAATFLFRTWIVSTNNSYTYTTGWQDCQISPDYTWSWETSSARLKAQSALLHKGRTDEFSYEVWNEMVACVKRYLDSCGLSWNTRYALYDETMMSASDRILTAKRYNSLRYNIGQHDDTALDSEAVSTNDTVKGQKHFIDLMNTYNDWCS